MNKGSKGYFDEVAPDWDAMRQEFFPDHVRERALEVAEVAAGAVAADVGAGTGFVTEALLRAGMKVIAVDQSAEMLELMREKFALGGDLDCRKGSAESLPIDDSSVDNVFANMYLHHVERPPEAIAEMVRTLRPGGKLVITDLDRHEYEFLRVEQHDRWLGFERDDISVWFSDAGLTDISVDCVGDNCCADSCGGEARAEISIFIASGTKSDAMARRKPRG
jgi:ubiquinone/menaquinone biosynthesis C-methylase UbiE